MERRDYSSSLANIIRDFLEEDDLYFSFDDQLGTFRFDLLLDRHNMLLDYLIEVFDAAYVVYANFPVGGDTENETMLNSLDDYIHQCNDDILLCNHSLLPSNFEFDRTDCTIRYKYYVDCAGINPSKEIVCESIYTPAALSDLYLPGFLAIIGRNATAKEANFIYQTV